MQELEVWQSRFVDVADACEKSVRQSSWPDKKAGMAAAIQAKEIILGVSMSSDTKTYAKSVINALGQLRDTEFIDPVDVAWDSGCGIGTFMDIYAKIREIAMEECLIAEDSD